MNMKINIPDEEIEKIKDELRREVTQEKTYEFMEEYLAKESLNLSYILKNYCRVYRRYDELINQKKESFNDEDRLIIALYTLLYDKF